MKQHHRDFGQLAEQPTKSLHSEYDRPFCKSDMGLTIHTSDNTKRRHSRAKENAKLGLNLLLLAVFVTGYASFIDLSLWPVTVTLGMIYALCCIIVPNESANEN